MGWQEIKDKYEAGASATEQSVEDMVARRVLRGLGLVEREFPRLEKAVFQESYYDDTLWSRVERLMKVVAQDFRVFNGYNLETIKVNGKHQDMVERFEGMRDEDPFYWRTVYLTRVGKTKNTLAYFISDPSGSGCGITTQDLKPPFTAIASIGSTLLLTQDIETFIKQFGPYDWKTYVN